jgi:hypothetical protein
VWLQVAGVSHRPAIFNKSVWCCLVDNMDQLQCTTSEITQLLDTNRM